MAVTSLHKFVHHLCKIWIHCLDGAISLQLYGMLCGGFGEKHLIAHSLNADHPAGLAWGTRKTGSHWQHQEQEPQAEVPGLSTFLQPHCSAQGHKNGCAGSDQRSLLPCVEGWPKARRRRLMRPSTGSCKQPHSHRPWFSWGTSTTLTSAGKTIHLGRRNPGGSYRASMITFCCKWWSNQQGKARCWTSC